MSLSLGHNLFLAFFSPLLFFLSRSASRVHYPSRRAHFSAREVPHTTSALQWLEAIQNQGNKQQLSRDHYGDPPLFFSPCLLFFPLHPAWVISPDQLWISMAWKALITCSFSQTSRLPWQHIQTVMEPDSCFPMPSLKNCTLVCFL